MPQPVSLLITCEHGGNRVPPRYRPLFRGHEALLETHRGHDPGALTLARDLTAAFNATLFVATVSRLSNAANRSVKITLRPRLVITPADETMMSPRL